MDKKYISTCYIDKRDDLVGRLYLSSDKSIYIDFGLKGIYQHDKEIIIPDRSYIILEILIKSYNYRVDCDDIKFDLWPDSDEYEEDKGYERHDNDEKNQETKQKKDIKLQMISNSISFLRNHEILGALFKKLLPNRNYAGYIFLLGEGIDIKRANKYKEDIEHISDLFDDIPSENLVDYIDPLNCEEMSLEEDISIKNGKNADSQKKENSEENDFNDEVLEIESERKRKIKKLLSIFIPIILIPLIALGVFFGNFTSSKASNDVYHITVSKPSNMSDEDLNILEERIKVFSDGKKYSMDITDTKIELYLPISAFAGNDIEYVLNAYLIRAINLYAYDLKSNNPEDNIFISRDDINEVKVLDGPIDGVDAAEYEIGTDDYKYFSITLSDDFVTENKAKIDKYGKNFTFAQDINDADGFYHYYTFPQDDAKTFYILNNDLGDNFVKLLEYNLTHESLSVSLNDYVIDINSKATWQNIEDTSIVGSNQCNFDDFSEGTITLSYNAYSNFTEGENVDTEKAFKQRFDVLGNKYAFGSYSDEISTLYIVKTTMDNLNLPLINIMGDYPNLVIRNKTSEYSFNYDIVNFTNNGTLNQISFIPKYYDEFYKEELKEFVDSVNESKDTTIYMFIGDMPILSTNVNNIDMNSGSVSFDKICQVDNGKVLHSDITSEYTYFADVLSAIAETNENMENLTLDEYQFNVNNRGNLPTENQFNLKYNSFDNELADKITEIYPDAKVDIKDFSVYVYLNLPIDDNLVTNAITISDQIYNTVNLEDSMINDISIYLVNENNAVMERGRIFFVKDFKSTYSEGGISVHGIFVNGRLEKYQEEFKEAIEKDELISSLNQDEYSWNF